jgi:putative ABC transport system ATP-binding protein
VTAAVPLQCRGLVLAFPDGPGRRTILDGLDLDVAAGELVTISGDSGSGKSTLLTVAGLLRRSDAGEVTIAGTETSALSERRRTGLRRDHIAFVYQSANLLPSLTALEQLQLVGHLRGRRPASTRARAQALLDELGIGDRGHQLPAELSGGERQRVGIARALIGEPDVLIADEPTASLDPSRASSVAELIAAAAHDRGIATLVVAHDDVTRRHADRHLRLHDGTLHSVEAAEAGPDVER